MLDLEEAVMGIIVNAGQSRSLCFEALRHAKQGQFIEAESLLQEANTFAKEAHAVQTQLIEADEGEGRECKKICVSGILNPLLKGNWNANYRPNSRSAFG